MSRFRDVFTKSKVFLPVIHCVHERQALENVDIARDQGADGVFLINHRTGTDDLLAWYAAVRRRHHGWWVGLNLLGEDAFDAETLVPDDASGLWVDDPGFREQEEDPCVLLRANHARRALRGRSYLYFGSVAFKYQKPVAQPAEAARRSAPYMDLVTTSGSGTGEAADLGKITSMKLWMGTAPLAIASGITPHNVTDYLPWVDAYLVATGISHTFTSLDPRRVRALADILSV